MPSKRHEISPEASGLELNAELVFQRIRFISQLPNYVVVAHLGAEFKQLSCVSGTKRKKFTKI